MKVFGFDKVPVNVSCEAQINFNNTDIMMVLDVTGSMAETNPGDSKSKLDTLKDTVKSFYNQLEIAASAGTRIRYGFVPYSTNVNVGGLLKDDWLVDKWAYQSRKLVSTSVTAGTTTYYSASSPVSGTMSTTDDSTYPAAFSEVNGYSCPSKPANTLTTSTSQSPPATEILVGPPAGVRKTVTITRTRNGSTYGTSLSGATCTVKRTDYVNYIDSYDQITEPQLSGSSQWRYAPVKIMFTGPTGQKASRGIDDTVLVGPDALTNWQGCIEERDTYEISNYNNVDMTKALDLNIDLVPNPNDAKTQWRPSLPDLIYARALNWNGTGSFSVKPVNSSSNFLAPQQAKTAACPPPAKLLSVMTGDEIDAYMNTLVAAGSTYHDIGMIWGGRLLSPDGLFAAQNADQSPSNPTSRHLIFLTDGQTSTLDISYSSYGLEPLDQRRWQPGSSLSLDQTVENRFAYACSEIRKKNITVWIIGFGTTLNPVMKTCAGDGHYFEAKDATELNATFAKIAKNMSKLRIMK